MRGLSLTLGVGILALALSGCLTKGTTFLPAQGTTPTPQILDAIGDHKGLLDLVGARIGETPSHLVVEIHVADLDPASLVQRLRAGAYRELTIDVCWNPDGNPNRPGLQGHECAGVVLFPDDKTPIIGHFSSGYGPEDGCNDWTWCEWHVPHTLTPGTPATVRVDVPRQLLLDPNASAVLVRPYAEISARRDVATPASQLGREAWVQGCVIGRCSGQGFRFEVASEGDTSANVADVVLELVPEFAPLGTGESTILVDQTGEARDARGPRKDLDIISVDIEETATEVAYVVKVAELPALANHEFDMDLGLNGVVYEAWYSARGGVATDAMFGYCVGYPCATWEERPVSVRLQPGSPGSIRVALRWSDMLQIPKGTLVTLAEAEVFDVGAARYQAVPVGGFLNARSSGAGDTAYYAEPYQLRLGSPLKS